MSALGHKRTLRQVRAMSALPPKADISGCRDLRADGLRRTYSEKAPIPSPGVLAAALWRSA